MARRTGTAQLRNAVLTEPWQTREETERDPEDAPLSEETLRRLSVPPYRCVYTTSASKPTCAHTA